MKRVGMVLVVIVFLGIVYTAMRGTTVAVEMYVVERRDVFEYITEDARTRLDDEYIIDMPIMGTVQRIDAEIGDTVTAGQVIAEVDTFALEQSIREVEAQIQQTLAFESGVDVEKPKEEDIASAELKVREMRDALEIAKNNHDVLEFNVAEAEKVYTRAKGLLAAGAGSESQFDEAELRYKGLKEDLKGAQLEEDAANKALEQADLAYKRLTGSIDDNEYMRDSYRAEIAGLEARLAALKDDLKKTKITAPVTGPVLEKYIQDRRVLAAGEPLLKIGDMASIEIECDVLSEEITPMRVGNRVEILGKAIVGRDSIFGEVERIYPSGFMKISSLGVEQQRVRTIIHFDNTDVGLRPGTSVDVRIITAEALQTLSIPDRALFRNEGEWSVYVVEGDTAKLHTVEVGLRNDDWAQITGGLEEGMMIVSELKNELEDGIAVTRID